RNRSWPEASKPRPEDDDRRQRNPAADRVHDRRPCEIDEAEILQPPLRAAARELSRTPGPVRKERVEDARDDDGDDEVYGKTHSLRNGSRDQRRCRGDEPEFEDEKREEKRPLPSEEELGCPDPALETDTEDQPEAEEPEKRGSNEEGREGLDRDIDRVLRPDQTALEARKARLHEQPESCANAEPADIELLADGHPARLSERAYRRGLPRSDRPTPCSQRLRAPFRLLRTCAISALLRPSAASPERAMRPQRARSPPGGARAPSLRAAARGRPHAPPCESPSFAVWSGFRRCAGLRWVRGGRRGRLGRGRRRRRSRAWRRVR